MAADPDRHQPYSHAAPLTAREHTALADLAARNVDMRPLLGRPTPRSRHLLRRSGWPAWVAAVAGLYLVQVGTADDLGWPLLVGAIITLTFNHWLLLPAVADLPTAVRRSATRARTRPHGAR